MLVTGNEILQDAHKNNYAVGAFNVNNMEIVQAIIEAAEETRSPVIIQASQGGLSYAGVEYIAALGKLAAEKASVPVALHLDHGTDFDQVMLCVRNGFSSIMIDGSKHEFEENIAITNKVMDVCRPIGVSVEAELGKIGGTEDDITVAAKDATFTDPQEAKEFVERTKVDSLAIAVGTAHGVYKGKPEIDFDRIKAIKELLNIPLVLHGSSGVADEDITRAVSLGINKINIDTDLRMAFSHAIHDFVEENPEVIDPRKILAPAKDAMKDRIKEKMELFGSAGRA